MKAAKRPQLSEESVETKRSITSEFNNLGQDFIKTAWKDFFVGSAQDMGGQAELLIGVAQGEMREGEAVSLKKQQEAEKQEKKTQTTEAHSEYVRQIVHADRLADNKENYAIQQQIEELRMQIKHLIATSKLVERVVKDAHVDKAPVRAGKYHKGFFDTLLSFVRDATRSLEDAATLGAMMLGKKNKQQYWDLYDKHGTTFGLSGERSVATQTG